MATSAEHIFCPYKGLQPYTEADRKYFFGRTRDEGIIISNLYAASVTVFYGASGVGKSSVLLAGAVPRLRQEPRDAVVVVFNGWQGEDFLGALKNEVVKQAGITSPIDTALPLDEFLELTQRTLGLPLFLIFDQFEEYFLYHPPSPSADAFESSFARAVNRRGTQINFFLSLREDGLSKLDRFQGRIPTLLNNMLRLSHLDRNSAREAIIKPLEQYNRELGPGELPMSIEDDLVTAVLNDLTTLRATSEQAGQGQVAAKSHNGAIPIETPFLQMVLTRLWNEETEQGSRVLRLQTFDALGRATNIARTHLDTIMGRLTDAERDDAANILRYMVTPSGAKIAQEAGALASWTELTEAQVQTILTRLSGPDMRILRTMQAPGEQPRFEIFHDVLAQAILNWRRRYVAQQEVERIRREEQSLREKEQEEAERHRELERSRRMRRAIISLSVVLVLMGGLLGFALWEWRQATKESKRADKARAEADDKSKKVEAAVHLSKAQLALQRKKFDNAVKEYDEAIKLDPKNPAAYSSKGYAQIRLGDKTGQYDEAIKTLEYLTSEVDPSYAFGHFNLALAYSKKGKDKEALQEAVAIIKDDKDFCKTFKDDPNYKWLLATDQYKTLCKGRETSSE